MSYETSDPDVLIIGGGHAGISVAVELNRIGQSPQVKDRLLAGGFEILPPNSPEDARKLIVDDQALWLPLIKQSGATAD